MELIDIEYPLPAPIVQLLVALVDVAKQNQVLSVTCSERHGKITGEGEYHIGNTDTGRVVSGIKGSPLSSLERLGFIEKNNINVFLYPIAFERAKYERKKSLSKLWTRILLHWQGALLVVTSIATFLLVILQVTEILGKLLK